MRNYVASLLILISLIVIVIPAILVRGCTTGGGAELQSSGGSVIGVFNHLSHKVQKMETEEYLKGVVAAEMPANFEMEALKAQAVLARTYVLRRIEKGITVPGHSDAVISTDFQSGQAWVSKQELQKRWGIISYLFNWNKISRAIEATRGEVLTYHGELVEALYHANAGGRTEDARNVWGNPIPYLKSVPSPYDGESPKFKQQFTFTWSALDKSLGTHLASLAKKRLGNHTTVSNLTGLIDVLQVSSGGRILQIRVAGKVLTGKDFRTLVGLPTNMCTFSPVPNGIRITTYGNGHGVGMSQYGANGMAKHGSTYLDILHHYYTGALIARQKGVQP